MRRLFAIIVAAIALVGCSKDNITESYKNDQNDIYYASFEEFGDDTRTYVDEDVKLLWHEDDRISLFRTTLNEQFKFTGATGANSGGFAAVPSDEWVTGNQVSTNYAVYPYDATTRLNNAEIIQLTMPAVQHYAENSFGRGANTMVAAAENISSRFLPFRNLGGYIIVKLYGEDTTIKSIEFKGNNDEIVAGAATAEAKYGYLPVVAMSESGTTTITLDCGEEGVTISSDSANPTSFWFVVPPITFEDGFTFTITDINDNTFTKSTTKSQTVVRNEVKSMSGFEPTFEGEGEEPEVAPKPANNEIWYTNGSTTEATKYDNSNPYFIRIISNTYDAEKQCWVIKFSKDVTKIDDGAFRDCYNLTSVTIPDSVTSIGDYAFEGCYRLTSITIPKSVTTIGKCAFYGCTGELIVNCDIPSASDSLYGAFYRSEFTSITIGDSVTTIGDYAFCYCESLTNITIPDSVTSIGESAFYYCKGLTSINIPDGVTEIGYSAFSSCSSLTSVTIGDSVTTIGNGAFSNCKSLTSVTIPDSVTTIGDSAFYYCTSLASVTIGDGVTTIGDHAFQNCYSLTSVTIGDSVTSIGKSAFEDCGNLESITIPNSVTTIGDYAFQDCDSLASATIGNGVTTIGYSSFQDCSSLASVTIGDRVTEIRSSTFAGCSSLISVTIPDSVTKIDGFAFRNCKNLTGVTIGDSVTRIYNSAFEGCSSLISIRIPDSVTEIFGSAFLNCDSLQEFKGKYASEDGRCLIFDGVLNSFAQAGLTEYAIPDSVTEIGYYTFCNCSGLTSISIPNRVTTIGDCAFYECNSLTSITIPDSVTEIGDYAFCNCSGLTSITIPDSVTEIGYEAFCNCDSLTSVTIGNGVTAIGALAFADCRTLTSVYCMATTPPSLGYDVFWAPPTDFNIYVPMALVEVYKSASGWSDYADYIEEDASLQGIVA